MQRAGRSLPVWISRCANVCYRILWDLLPWPLQTAQAGWKQRVSERQSLGMACDGATAAQLSTFSNRVEVAVNMRVVMFG